MRVEYGCLPRWQGSTERRSNRAKVVFSRHDAVNLEADGSSIVVSVAAGASYFVTDEDVRLQRIDEHSETIDLYPDADLLTLVADACGGGLPSLRGSIDSSTRELALVPGLLGIATRLRAVCVGGEPLTDIEASALSAAFIGELIALQGGSTAGSRSGPRLDRAKLSRVFEYIEDNLDSRITLDELCSHCNLSLFRFAHEFRRMTGLPPARFVINRRIDRAKLRLKSTDQPVRNIATSLGFENISHFRRQFTRLVGVRPGEFRRITG